MSKEKILLTKHDKIMQENVDVDVCSNNSGGNPKLNALVEKEIATRKK